MEMIILPRLIYIAKKKRLFDVPDYRKLHACTIPRLGGASFMPVILLITCFLLFVRNEFGISDDLLSKSALNVWLLLVCGMHLIYLVGIKDDIVGVNYRVKFLIQLIAAVCVVCSGVYINNFYGLFGLYEISDVVGIPLTVLVIMFVTNSINLIDGADGLASGLSSIAFFVYGVLFCMFNMWTYASIAFTVLGTLTVFFYYNFLHPTRKIFMGDTGSLTLGYLLAFMMIHLISSAQAIEIMPSGFPLLVLAALFIPPLDAFRVMVLRMAKKRAPFSPDRSHVHHMLIDLGLSRKRAVFVLISGGVLFFASNALLLLYINCNIVLALDIVAWVGITALLYKLIDRKGRANA
ncbi:MraY family glycosyltransferase [Viscerimonas tarda]